jgi:hypothetical protein
VPWTLQGELEWGWRLVFATLFAGYVVADRSASRSAPSFAHRPFGVLGALGTLSLALLLTFEFTWRGARRVGEVVLGVGEPGLGTLALLASLGAGSLVLAFREARATSIAGTVYALAPVTVLAAELAFVGLGDGEPGARQWPALLMNVYVVALGAAHLAVGYRRLAMVHANFGMLLLCVLVVLRFFDHDLSLVYRALAFMLLGAGSIVVNVLLHRQRSRLTAAG